MSYRRVYYSLKSFIPKPARIGLRRWMMKRKLVACRRIWPILESAGKPPGQWKGWPDGRRFAFVLTHDVEGPEGLAKCRDLMNLDLSLGFRSSFNFVPEGLYRTPVSLREELVRMGFEVGVHDLKHDGKMFRSKQAFEDAARRINAHLRNWNAVGFRSGFMHSNLEWMNYLNIRYDSSTFDTDPFEPQTDGVGTIFPFRVSADGVRGYLELPYTLVQDFNLFVILEQKSIRFWQEKLDWIAARGGMALVDVHPDYMHFAGGRSPAGTYPASFYREFLEYAKSRYGAEYWHATPHEVADFALGRQGGRVGDPPAKPGNVSTRSGKSRKIWIDLDNTPHVPFFEPILAELRSRGYTILLTARDAFQVFELAEQRRLEFIRVGRHSGKNPVAKILGLIYRSAQLAPHVVPFEPTLAISHGSRAQAILCNVLGIGSALIADYEHGKPFPFMRADWEIAPEIIPDAVLHCPSDRIRKYPGLKEDVYAPRFRPDPSLQRTLGIIDGEIVVTVRPPATEAHYHNPESEVLFAGLMRILSKRSDIRTILLPRNARQAAVIKSQHPEWFGSGKIIIPEKAVDGMNLIWHSDLVVSGGGTMNREAAALNVPVYSIFRGPRGAVDRNLSEQGRLTIIESQESLEKKIQFRKRERDVVCPMRSGNALECIVNYIEEIYAYYENRGRR